MECALQLGGLNNVLGTQTEKIPIFYELSVFLRTQDHFQNFDQFFTFFNPEFYEQLSKYLPELIGDVCNNLLNFKRSCVCLFDFSDSSGQ